MIQTLFSFPMKVCLFLVFILGQVKGFSQKYEKLRDGADTLYEHQHYCEALRMYQQAYQIGKHTHCLEGMVMKYNLACSFARCGKTDSALLFLHQTIEAGFTDEAHLRQSKSLSQLVKDSLIFQQIKRHMEVKRKEIDAYAGVRKRLELYEREDQAPADAFRDTVQKFGINSPQALRFRDEMNKIRTPHRRFLDSLIPTSGFPGPDLIGPEGVITIFLIVQHADMDLSYQEKYLPVFLNAREEGKLPSGDCALLEDRILVGHHKKQKYGSQLKFDIAKGCYSLEPLENPERVDALRESVGLQPLKEYLNYFHVCK